MQKITAIIFIIFTVFVNTSCEEGLNLNGDHQPSLSVNFYKNSSCPERFYLPVNKNYIGAVLSQTLDLADTVLSHSKVENARIEIYADDELILLVEPQDEKNIYFDFDPVEGKTYKVYGYADNYPVLSGECTIPFTVSINYIEHVYKYELLEEDHPICNTCNNILEGIINFTDPKEYTNIYFLQTYFYLPNDKYRYALVDFIDPIIEDNGVFSDEFINGNNYSIKFKTRSMSCAYDNFPIEDCIFIIELWSISESYYHSIKSSFLLKETNNNLYAEPVQLYSNVNNGLGVISASSVARDTINLCIE